MLRWKIYYLYRKKISLNYVSTKKTFKKNIRLQLISEGILRLEHCIKCNNSFVFVIRKHPILSEGKEFTTQIKVLYITCEKRFFAAYLFVVSFISYLVEINFASCFWQFLYAFSSFNWPQLVSMIQLFVPEMKNNFAKSSCLQLMRCNPFTILELVWERIETSYPKTVWITSS